MIEKIIEFIAPDECIVCQKEGICLCTDCAQTALEYKKPACLFCNELNPDGRVCRRCRSKNDIYKSSIAYRYGGASKELINLMKYQGRRSVARYLASKLPAIETNAKTIITYVPSDGASRRKRGFDQAELIAKHYAKSMGDRHSTLLARREHERQVGKSRKSRIENVKDNFVALSGIPNAEVVLIDDVVTTGATVSECAKVLKRAGAKRVEVLAVAKK